MSSKQWHYTLLLLLLCRNAISTPSIATARSSASSPHENTQHTKLAKDLFSSPVRIVRSRENEWKLVKPHKPSKEWSHLHTSKLSPLPSKEEEIRKKSSILRENFTFKGFGISFYKSLLKLNSLGVAFRIPVLGNFDWWDRQPGLPSLNLFVTFFLPFRVSIGVSSSIDCNAIKWAFINFLSIAINQVIRTLYIIASILLFPFVGRMLEPRPFTFLGDHSAPKYKTDVQERVGCTMWYRWSLAKGYDTRISYWHMYLPTLRACCKLLPIEKLPQWCETHCTSLGTDSTITSASELFLTGIVSMSGLHFRRAPRQNPSLKVQKVYPPLVKLEKLPMQTVDRPEETFRRPIARGGEFVTPSSENAQQQ